MEGEEKDNSQLPYFTARLTVGGAKGAQLFSLKGSYQGSPGGSAGKESACSAGDPGLNPKS